MGFFDKIKQGLKKTSDSITQKIDLIVNSFTSIDEELFEELEMALISADIAVATVEAVLELVRQDIKTKGIKDPVEVKGLLRDRLIEKLTAGARYADAGAEKSVILVIGVNGVGKTTTIGKLAKSLVSEGKKTIVVAGDTFRAAATQQLGIWAERSGAAIVSREQGADPASVVFDGVSAFKARNADRLIIDTAGRLHNKDNLMAELEKISRIVDRELPGVRRETFLILDATTGQNALSQAMAFEKTAGLSALVLTKLDGTAKGGIAITICDHMQVPIAYIGVGEGEDDLIPFDEEDFVNAILP